MTTRRCFSRKSRMLHPSDFSGVFKQRRVINGGILRLMHSPNQLGQPRLGLAIAKKHLRLAVKRNLVKRLVRESFRQGNTHFPAEDIVIMTCPGIEQCDRAQLQHGVSRLWRKYLAVSAGSSAGLSGSTVAA